MITSSPCAALLIQKRRRSINISILYPIVNMQEAAEGKLPPDAIGVRAIDPQTLEILTRYQTPYIGQLLMHQTMYAVPRHVVEKLTAALG